MKKNFLMMCVAIAISAPANVQARIVVCRPVHRIVRPAVIIAPIVIAQAPVIVRPVAVVRPVVRRRSVMIVRP